MLIIFKLLVLLIFRISKFYLTRRNCCGKTNQIKTESAEQIENYQRYSKSGLDCCNKLNSSPDWTVESYKDNIYSDPVYVDIGEIVTDTSDEGYGETEDINHSQKKEKIRRIYLLEKVIIAVRMLLIKQHLSINNSYQ